MENKFDIKLYKQKLNKVNKLKENIKEAENQIHEMFDEINIKVGKQLLDIVLKVFTLEELGDFEHFDDRLIGRYFITDTMISYKLDLVEYLMSIYKQEYPDKINRRFKRDLFLYLEYNMESGKIFQFVSSNGFYTNHGVIQDKALNLATQELINTMVDEINTGKVRDIEEIEQVLKKIKEIINNHSAYYVAHKLID